MKKLYVLVCFTLFISKNIGIYNTNCEDNINRDPKSVEDYS